VNAAPANGLSQSVAPPGRSLPHNLSAEKSILGGVILKNSVLVDLDTLESKDFYDHRHKVIWEAIRNLEHARQPIDPTTLEVEIERQGKLDAIGGHGGAAGAISYLGEIVLHCPTVENVIAYAKNVRDLSMLRQLALRASRAVEKVYGWEHEADELLGETLADLQLIERRYREDNDRIPFISIADSLDEIERLSTTPVFETPFPELNRALGFEGLLAGQVYYLAGGTGFGKTSWIGRVVRHVAAQGRWALIAFWEMFSGYYTAKMAGAIVGASSNQILRGRVDRNLILSALPPTIQMLDSPSMSMLRRAAEHHVRLGHGAPLIVVDYLQLLAEKIMETMPRPEPRLATAMASGHLRELAKATGAAIIVVSAAGRAASKDLTKDVRKKPARDLIAASRESGSVEFDGAGVIVLSVSDEKDGDEDIATMSVAKARFGMTAHIDARFDGRTGDWREIGKVAKLIDLPGKPDDGSVRAAIVDALRKPDAKFGSRTQIWKATGKGKQSVLSEIGMMLDDGSLSFDGRRFELQGELVIPVPDAPQLELERGAE